MLTKAGNTKNTANEAEIEEKLKLAYQDYYLGQHTETGYTFQNAVDKMFGEGVATVTESNDVYKVTFTNGKKYTFNALTKEVAELEEIWTQNGTIVTNTKTGQVLEVGDTVYYDSGVEAYEGTGDNQGKWGILGAEEGKLLIMSKENVVSSITLSAKQDWLATDGTFKLNNACSSFKNATYAEFARSIKLEDINRLVKQDFVESTSIYTLENGYVKSSLYSEPSTWCDTFKHIDGRKLPDDGPISVDCKFIDYDFDYYFRNSEFVKAYNLLKCGNNGYWIGTRIVFPGYESAIWGFYYMWNDGLYRGDLWDSINAFDGYSDEGVRAVVSLKSNIKLSGSSSSGWTLQQ